VAEVVLGGAARPIHAAITRPLLRLRENQDHL